MSKIWFITGASRGFGTLIAQAALAAGDKVIATARGTESLTKALGPETDHLAFAPCNVTNDAEVETAVALGVARFGGVSVLVNNAGYGQFGMFEETTPADAQAQFATNVFGVFAVTRAVLPHMRAARAGHIFNFSSIAGLRGSPGGSLYAASKHALEGWSEALAGEISGFGITLTIVEPGFFRTGFLSPDSVRLTSAGIPDYAEAAAQRRAFLETRNGQQAGDPAKLADAIITLAATPIPPLHFVAGADALAVATDKIAKLSQDLDAWRDLSSHLGFA